MPDATLAAGAIGAGVLVSTAVLVACGGAMSAYGVVRTSVRNTVARIVVARSARARLAVDLDRAGWRESPERICVLAIALAACLAVLGATTISALTTSGAAGSSRASWSRSWSSSPSSLVGEGAPFRRLAQ